MIPHSYPSIGPEDVAAVTSQLETGQLDSGEVAEQLAREVAATIGDPGAEALATASGTEALSIALLAVGVEPGRRVIVPTYSCRALADATLAIGAQPVAIDSGPDYALSPSRARDAGEAAAAVIVHPFGHLVDLEPYRDLGCPLIADCAHALPLGGEPAADASVFSFHTTKLLAAGEGGAVVAHSPEAGERLGELATGYASSGEFRSPIAVPLSDLGAALALSQLARIEAMSEKRRMLAQIYDELLGKEVEVDDWAGETPFRYIVRTDAPFEQVRTEMEQRGVAVRRPVDPLLHRDMGLDGADFAVAEGLFARTISLPLYPSLEEADARLIASALLEACASGAHS
jgi:dTDP-4-amino-4,6-dideoxygalactose transaminase